MPRISIGLGSLGWEMGRDPLMGVSECEWRERDVVHGPGGSINYELD